VAAFDPVLGGALEAGSDLRWVQLAVRVERFDQLLDEVPEVGVGAQFTSPATDLLHRPDPGIGGERTQGPDRLGDVVVIGPRIGKHRGDVHEPISTALSGPPSPAVRRGLGLVRSLLVAISVTSHSPLSQ
jgi:hypothetical protein